MNRWQVPACSLFLILPGCLGPSGDDGTGVPRGPVPLYEGLGDHHRPVSKNAEAQRYFDQGLIWTFAFNHDEAIRSYRRASELDPDCPMPWWGIALCNGPHINNPIVPPARAKAAWNAAQRAVSLKGRASPADAALIDAVVKRYSKDPAADRAPLDKAYAEAMVKVFEDFPNDADLGVLCAEALMDLQPWDLWNKDGTPRPGTMKILETLEKTLTLAPKHPGVLHLYIHAVEASSNPGQATEMADRLRYLVPGAGHLVHMPSHIDVLTGRWAEASNTNQRAIEVDNKYRSISARQGFYHIYMAHNHHMLSFAAMMEGRSEVAIRAARELVAGVPESYAKSDSAFVDPFLAIVPETLMRFGRWDEVLREPRPAEYLPVSTALWHYTRAVAHAAKGQLPEADYERGMFKASAERVPPDALMMINKAHHVLSIAEHMLNGEIAYRRGNIDKAVTELTEAIRLEDDLKYMEPPEWIQPVRHTLGAILLEAGRTADAEKVYREDLKEWPENGWSLYGLSQCLKKRGQTAEADELDKRFARVWSRADVKIHASCLCVAAK